MWETVLKRLFDSTFTILTQRRIALAIFIVTALHLTGCARPDSMLVRSGVHPSQQDEDVLFRTTYYFRVFDYCANQEDSLYKGIPKTTALYRFRMTGKADSLGSKVHFESGTLKSWQIDPLGATVIFDKNTGRPRFQSQQDTDDEARRMQAYSDFKQAKIDFEELCIKENNKNGDPSAEPPTLTEVSVADMPACSTLKTIMDKRLKDYASISKQSGLEGITANDIKISLETKENLPEEARLSIETTLKKETLKVIAGVELPELLECNSGVPSRRGFQILGPEGWRTFNQDERLLLAMSSSGKPMINALKELSNRVLKASSTTEGIKNDLIRARFHAFRAEQALINHQEASDAKEMLSPVITALQPNKEEK